MTEENKICKCCEDCKCEGECKCIDCKCDETKESCCCDCKCK